METQKPLIKQAHDKYFRKLEEIAVEIETLEKMVQSSQDPKMREALEKLKRDIVDYADTLEEWGKRLYKQVA